MMFDSKRFTGFSLAATLTLFGGGACGDTNVEHPTPTEAVGTVAQASGTQCLFTTDFIDAGNASLWQDTVANPGWRSIQAAKEPGVDFDIQIDADALNNGVIPTAPGQGHYKSEEDYLDTLSTLLGVDVQTTTFFLSVKGTTIKSDGDYLLDTSTGVFIYDALSDEKGRIYIDGVDMTAQYINPDRFHDYDIDYSKLNSTQLAQVNTLNSPPITAFNLNPLTQLVDSATLFTNSGAWRADLNKFYSPFYVGYPDAVYNSEAYAQIKNVTDCYQYNVAPCTYVVAGTTPITWERSCSTAETLSLEMNVFAATQTQPQIAYRITSANNARALDLSFVKVASANTPANNTESCTKGNALFEFGTPNEEDKDNVKTNGAAYADCPG